LETGVLSTTLSDRDLVDLHVHGDPDAFEELFTRFHPMVFNLALRLTGREEDAADLTQEAFVKIYRHLRSFRGASALSTWVYRVALNTFRSRLRRSSRQKKWISAVDREDLERSVDDRPGPEERAMRRDAHRQLTSSLAELPLVFREAVVLRDIEGLTYEEIAAVLKVRIGTVRSRIARGRDRLRILLETVNE